MREYECIVIDDGAPSGRTEICTLVSTTGAIYIPSGTDGGCGGGYSRNIGISQAKGTYIAFLDDDDAWEMGKLSEQIGFMKSTDLPFSYTGMYIRNRNGHVRYSFRTPAGSDYHRAIMRKNFIGTTSTVIIRTDALLSVGGFDTALPALQDYDLYIRLLQKYGIGWLREPLTIYYDNDTNDKISQSRERYLAAVRILSNKYHDDPCYPLLRRSFMEIALLKCIRSRRFFLDTIRSLMKR
jgi:GT2 family glycosyltransferase